MAVLVALTIGGGRVASSKYWPLFGQYCGNFPPKMCGLVFLRIGSASLRRWLKFLLKLKTKKMKQVKKMILRSFLTGLVVCPVSGALAVSPIKISIFVRSPFSWRFRKLGSVSIGGRVGDSAWSQTVLSVCLSGDLGFLVSREQVIKSDML